MNDTPGRSSSPPLRSSDEQRAADPEQTRTAGLDRQTQESKVHVEVDHDGSGRSHVSTGVGV
jgi:hypothetical protein